ncbi:type II secretion system protein [Agaribacterium haliotis]|uniref:type II secretion system protein n=1 Tax=Agaribacterium haliotis TaxID=2013869 RepID=UPI000BB54D54|nr:type II secretion system protein [Agaribacterium haliotis]
MKSRPANKGFSLLELIVVVCLIAILFAISVRFYIPQIEDSQRKTLNFQAAVFKRSVDNIHALSALQGGRSYTLSDGTRYYLNQWGWPVSSNALEVNPRRRVSDLSCRSLWLGLFSQVEAGTEQATLDQFIASAASRRSCRYSLSRTKEALYFFDYDIKTGKLSISIK